MLLPELQFSSLEFYLKKSCGTGVFLWNLEIFRNVFIEHLRLTATVSIYYNSTAKTFIGNNGLRDRVLTKTIFWQMWNRFLMFFTCAVIAFILRKVEGWTCLIIFLSLLLRLCWSWMLNQRFAISILNNA